MSSGTQEREDGTDESRWRRIDALFDACLDLPQEERERLLTARCEGDRELRRAVERLLAVEAEAGCFLGDASLEQPLDTDPPADELAGTRLGPYRLVRTLGRGGMGTVYLAQREDDFRQEVAVKLVRRSLLSRLARQRLHTEGQALARLEHPNIARLYAGGTTDDGLPYLVMERVVGEPIDRYCRRRELGVRRRVELMLQVLAAVAHAHHHLRVHCDIKPSNILVTDDGTPKLLDFGIAKLLSPEERSRWTVTATGLRPLTPAYASPEQVRGGPITRASDLYSVGVLLYELLCGRLPYAVDGTSEAALSEAIVEVDPAPPSRVAAAAGERELARRLRGDLDAIVLRAIRKEPGRRYASAEAFADDLSRHLESRPVLARRRTWRYRAGRFLRRLLWPPDPRRRRERWAWASVAAAAALVAVGVWLHRPQAWCPDPASRLRGVWDAARRAQVEVAFRASGVPFAADTFRRAAAALDAYAARWSTTEREVCRATLVRGERSSRLLDLSRLCLDARREQLRTLVELLARPEDDLVIEAVASVHQLGDLGTCNDPAELATRRLPPADPQVRQRLDRLRSVIEGQALRLQVTQRVDLAALRTAEEELRQIDDPVLLARLLHVLGQAESVQGQDQDVAVAHLEEAARVAIEGGDRPQQARTYAALTKILAKRQGDFERARFWEGFATASLQSLGGAYPEVEVEVHQSLGLLRWEMGRWREAREEYRLALESAERLGDPTRQITVLNQLGLFDPQATEQSIELIERYLGPDHSRLASPLLNRAAHLASAGAYEEALPLARRSHDLLRATHGDEHGELGYPLVLSGQILVATDRPGDAVEPLSRAVEVLTGSFDPRAQIVRDARVALAEALLLAGDVEAGAEQAAAAEAALTPDGEPDHPARLYLLRVVGDVLRAAGDLDGALKRHEELLARLDDDGPDLAPALWSVARTYQAAGRGAEALPLLERALATVSDQDRWRAAGIRVSLAEILRTSDPQRARGLVTAAREGLAAELPLHQELLRRIERRWGQGS